MRPIFFGSVRLDDGVATFEVLFPNREIDGDHQVAIVTVRQTGLTLQQAQDAAAKQFFSMTEAELSEVRKHAQLIDRDAIRDAEVLPGRSAMA